MVNDNTRDDHVDDEIYACLSLAPDNVRKSFILYADAGSGKTRSLVNTLLKLRDMHSEYLLYSNKKIAVITYTNAACDVIKKRVEYSPLFHISTIHSFIWDVIKPFQNDIKLVLQDRLKNEIEDLLKKQSTGRAGTKAAIDREHSIDSKTKRLQFIASINCFTYNPNGDNTSRDSLGHTEVIAIGSILLTTKPLLQTIFVSQYPILLIDESQDTNKALIETLFALQAALKGQFSLGLFGDSMQRIYMDGKENLDSSIPSDWETPSKVMNHRCSKRIIKLINRIRSYTDGHVQIPRSDKGEGLVKLFLCGNTLQKDTTENKVAEIMAEKTGCQTWSTDAKRLILEHRMAARRLGFLKIHEAFAPLNNTGYLDGSLSGMHLFTELILPLITAHKRNDHFSIARIIKKSSPLMRIIPSEENQMQRIRYAQESVDKLLALWDYNADPTCMEILQCIARQQLFDIPSPLAVIVQRSEEERSIIDAVDKSEMESESEEGSDLNKINAWDKALQAPFSEVEAYHSYISNNSQFDTHQGVKGEEFPHVMAIIDDEESKGFLFNYEKLFGVKAKTNTDLQNEKEGKDSSIDRTRRLFYVICSRALESLAIVMYTSNTNLAQEYVVNNEWFEECEVVIID